LHNETASDFSGFPHGGGGGIRHLVMVQHPFGPDRLVFLIIGASANEKAPRMRGFFIVRDAVA
jgi:hypothetical protein